MNTFISAVLILAAIWSVFLPTAGKLFIALGAGLLLWAMFENQRVTLEGIAPGLIGIVVIYVLAHMMGRWQSRNRE